MKQEPDAQSRCGDIAEARIGRCKSTWARGFTRGCRNIGVVCLFKTLLGWLEISLGCQRGQLLLMPPALSELASACLRITWCGRCWVRSEQMDLARIREAYRCPPFRRSATQPPRPRRRRHRGRRSRTGAHRAPHHRRLAEAGGGDRAFATSKVVFLKDVGIGTEAAVLIGYVHRSGAAPFRR